MKTNPIIALIDDDDAPTLYYERDLNEAGFTVVRKAAFSDALLYIRNPDPAPNLWVIDIMMPLGKLSEQLDGADVAKRTNHGLAAGMFLYRTLRRRDKITPAILLTSIATPEMLDDIEATLDPPDVCESKLEMPPSRLVSIAIALFNSNKSA